MTDDILTLDARIKAALATFGVQDVQLPALRYDDPAPGRTRHTSKLRDALVARQVYEGEHSRWVG